MPFPVIKPEGGSVAASVIAPNLSQFARGTTGLFEQDFFEDAPTNSVPAVPNNPATDPSWVLVDADGNQVATGVAAVGAMPGRWQFNYAIPQDAVLSTVSHKWRVIWGMVTGAGRELRTTVPFDVIELRTPDTLDDLRDYAYFEALNESARIVLRLPRPVEDTISVKLFKAAGLDSPVIEETPVFTVENAGIHRVEEQNLFTYYFDTPALSAIGEYQIQWRVRYTLTSPTETIVQQLFVPPPLFHSLEKSLRVLIDKLQKKSGTLQSYSSPDVYEYFLRGLGYLNAVTPVTNWNICTFPYNTFTVRFLIQAAALWAMQAQHLLSGETRFSFSGQQITLDLDPTDVYADVIQRLMEELGGDGKASWPAAKVGMTRQTGVHAIAGGRTMGRTVPRPYTTKIYSQQVDPNAEPLFSNLEGPGPIGFGNTLTDVLVGLRLF